MGVNNLSRFFLPKKHFFFLGLSMLGGLCRGRQLPGVKDFTQFDFRGVAVTDSGVRGGFYTKADRLRDLALGTLSIRCWVQPPLFLPHLGGEMVYWAPRGFYTKADRLRDLALGTQVWAAAGSNPLCVSPILGESWFMGHPPPFISGRAYRRAKAALRPGCAGCGAGAVNQRMGGGASWGRGAVRTINPAPLS